jgi:hypothetical protein
LRGYNRLHLPAHDPGPVTEAPSWAYAGPSRHEAVAQAMDYMLKCWSGSEHFLDGRICLANDAAERAPLGLALRP